MRIHCKNLRERIVKCIKVVTKMTLVQIRAPLRVKENAIESHEIGLSWEKQTVAVQVVKI